MLVEQAVEALESAVGHGKSQLIQHRPGSTERRPIHNFIIVTGRFTASHRVPRPKDGETRRKNRDDALNQSKTGLRQLWISRDNKP